MVWEVLFVIFAVAMTTTNSCTCDLPHPQNKFCSSHFVVKATVVSENVTMDDQNLFPLVRDYTIQYNATDIFKGSDFLGRNGTSVIRTSGVPWNCGTTFEVDSEYLITGFAREGELFTSQCSWNMKYASLTSHQKQGINSTYGLGCNCTVFRCFGRFCERPDHQELDPDRVCIWQGRQDRSGCFAKYGFCLQDEGGICYWKDESMLGGCLQDTEPANVKTLPGMFLH